MIGGFETWTAILIAIAAGGGIVRQILRRHAAPEAAHGPTWRFAALVGLQAIAGVLLHLTLFPPSIARSPGRLVVATRGATPGVPATGDVLVALPEAGPMPGALRVPDLGSALRLHPDLGRLRIEGEGLTPRDRIPLDRPAEFAPAAPPRGIVDLALPDPVAPGARFVLAGQVGALPSGTVELLDPSGAVVDRAAVTSNGRFNLSAATRAAGLALFELRLRDTAGRQVEHVEIPVEARAQRQPRVLVLAGAASPEIKYLRRWAQDAGIALSLDVDLGSGVVLGDPTTPLTRAALSEVDLVVVDDRRWETLSAGARWSLDAATREGMGLLLRPTGPLSAITRRDWAGLGVATSGDGEAKAFRLEGSALEAAVELNRLDLSPAGRDGVPMVRDKAGAPLAAWRPRGQGRVGLWTVSDSHALALTGQVDRYGDLWGQLFSTLARPGDAPGVNLPKLARAGERATLCAVTGEERVIDPAGVESRLRRDPATGEAACAGYWPRRSGWHRILTGGKETAFYVQPADTAPSLAHTANREATLDLVAGAADGVRSPRPLPGSPWPWAAALLLALAALWWLERRSPRS